MRKWIMMMGGCLLSMALWAQTGFKVVADPAAFKQQFAKVSQQTQSLQSDFVQEKNLSMLSDKIVSKGKFWFKRENKVRMEYQQPSYYLLVMNGKDIKTKDTQKENRVSAKSNKLFEQINKIMIDCVQGNVLDNEAFQAQVMENAQYYQLELKPVNKALAAFFKTIHLLVSKQDYAVVKITMHEITGDDTAISFVNKQVNVNIPDAVFSIK
ncbi:outer membrane lipoprotein carrier protein LolA [Chitinophaga defluvii]|uniref:Outer membrane lipoprotein carrier protein LolA n=1 Tax=Chitinophaga defluvii TaxID=3163343 RepID=A0ABV2TCT5_9BACT